MNIMPKVIKELLFLLFNRIFSDQMANARSVSFNLGIKKGRSDIYEERDNAELCEMHDLLGKPVICLSNEWENPVIGFATHIQFITLAQNPVLMVRDYISGEELMVMGKVLPYSRTRLEAILKLTPYEAISLLYTNFEISTTKPKRATRHTAKTIERKLETSGFGDELNRYYHQQLETMALLKTMAFKADDHVTASDKAEMNHALDNLVVINGYTHHTECKCVNPCVSCKCKKETAITVQKQHPFSISNERAKFRKGHIHRGIKQTIQPELMDTTIKSIFTAPFKVRGSFLTISVFTPFKLIPFNHSTTRYFAPLG